MSNDYTKEPHPLHPQADGQSKANDDDAQSLASLNAQEANSDLDAPSGEAEESASENDKEVCAPIRLKKPDSLDLKPRITVFGVGGGGGNAVSNMIAKGMEGAIFVAANTDAQALKHNRAENKIQLGLTVSGGLGAGSISEIGAAAAQETEEDIRKHLEGANMVFITAGMGGGTGSGAAPIIAKVAKEMSILTVGVVTKPFSFEGTKRTRTAEEGIKNLQEQVDSLIIIPNQNLFRISNEKTTFGDSFSLADEILYKGVTCITDLIVKKGLINLDFADVRAIMKDMGRAMMGTGEAEGEGRALEAAEQAINNPLLDEVNLQGARGLLISIIGGDDIGLYEVDEAASHIRAQVDPDANVIVGMAIEDDMQGRMKVSVVATGLPQAEAAVDKATELRAAPRVQLVEPTASDHPAPSPARSLGHAKDARVSEARVASSLASALGKPVQDAGPTATRTASQSPAPGAQAPTAGENKEGILVSQYKPDAAVLRKAQSETAAAREAEASVYVPAQPTLPKRDVPQTGAIHLSTPRQKDEASAAPSPSEAGPVQSMLRKLAFRSDSDTQDKAPKGTDQTSAPKVGEASRSDVVSIPAFFRSDKAS